MKEKGKKTNCFFYYKKNLQYLYFSIYLVLSFLLMHFISCKNKTKEISNIRLEGGVFGTSYSIIYDSECNYEKQIDSLFYVINKSLSTYQVNSDISKLNRNEAVEVDAHFKIVFAASKDIYNKTEGAFDPTIGKVVNAWDFGPEEETEVLDSTKIDSLMQFVGLDKVVLKQNIVLKPIGVFLDFNAIAKGHAVDVVAGYLESKNIENYLINIGGEINAKGLNIEKNRGWTVGIQDPENIEEESLGKPITLINESMATSGTYRKYKLDENGHKYAHIIDTQTGYPSKTNLLSISVIAEDCRTADAYATAFKVMGIDKIKAFLKEHTELKVFLIFENNNKELEALSLNSFPEN